MSQHMWYEGKGGIQLWRKIECCFGLWRLADVVEPRNSNLMGERERRDNCHMNSPVHRCSDETSGAHPLWGPGLHLIYSDVSFFSSVMRAMTHFSNKFFTSPLFSNPVFSRNLSHMAVFTVWWNS